MIIRVNILGVLVGIVSAMLGIGGGVIVAPVFLQLGLEPSESSATTSFVTLFTSFTNLIKYMLIGSIIWDYSIFFLHCRNWWLLYWIKVSCLDY